MEEDKDRIWLPELQQPEYTAATSARPRLRYASASMKSKKDVKFNHNERRESRSSMSDDNKHSPIDEKSPMMRNNGAKSPTRNGSLAKSLREEQRPGVDRTDTTQSGWATENEDEKVTALHEAR